jgi:hypothetical protein
MGHVKKRIKELVKESGGRNRAKKSAELWFETSRRKMNEKQVVFTRDKFQPGKIYVFRYDDPKYKNTLEWWDRNPVVLAIYSEEENDLGINLNLLPIKIKEELLDFIYDRLEGLIKLNTMGNRANNAERQRHLSLTYTVAKSFLERFGFDFAIRQYIPSRKANQAVVAYEKWPEVALCDFIDINGGTITQVHAMYRNHLRKKNI